MNVSFFLLLESILLRNDETWSMSVTERGMACCSDRSVVLGKFTWSRGIGGGDAVTGRTRRSLPQSVAVKNLRAMLDDDNKRSGKAALSNAQIVREELVGLIGGEERGLRTRGNRQKRDEIVKAIGALAALGTDIVTTDESLTAPWRVLWTTEKEQLFIVEKAYLFGTQTGDILQVIDVARGTLKNVITFPPTGMFLVNSTIEVVSAQRMNFRFTGASLRVGDWTIPVPPFGKGWFESVYLDEKIRVAKDIRGDYLVCDRAPRVPNLL